MTTATITTTATTTLSAWNIHGEGSGRSAEGLRRYRCRCIAGDLAHEWSRIYDRRKEAFRKRLGWWLKNRQGRYAAGWAVVAAEDDTKAKVVRYAVNPAADFASDGTAGAGVLGF